MAFTSLISRSNTELTFFSAERGGTMLSAAEASGPDVAEWSDIEGIAGQWDRPKADKTYLE
ncbi:hypothetical protein, partial [Nocardia sp. NPDC004260]